jgi:hypothetical protein
MMRKNVFVFQDKLCELRETRCQTDAASAEFDSNSEHLVAFVPGLQKIRICTERLRKRFGV